MQANDPANRGTSKAKSTSTASSSDEITRRFHAWNKVYQELVLAEHMLMCMRQEGDIKAWQRMAEEVAALRRRSEELLAQADAALSGRRKPNLAR